MTRKPNVILIAGPRQSGKSTLLRWIAGQLCPSPPHGLRLVSEQDPEAPKLTLVCDLETAGLASWKRVNYDAERVFEQLPESLFRTVQKDRSATVLVEADEDPNLRFAYSFDHRIFIMPSPISIDEVFRTPAQSAQALKEVMDDTAAFASEIFGLFDPRSDEDNEIDYQRIQGDCGAAEERLEITPAQMRRFVNSPLGIEIASRIQLQPAYHGLVESDLVVVNMGLGGTTEPADRAVRQIVTLVNRLGSDQMHRTGVYQCNLFDAEDPLLDPLRKKLAVMVNPGAD